MGSGISSGKLHIYTDLPTVIAGSGGGAIRTGRHTRYPEGTPIANLWLSMAQIMGVKTNRFADSIGIVPVHPKSQSLSDVLSAANTACSVPVCRR